MHSPAHLFVCALWITHAFGTRSRTLVCSPTSSRFRDTPTPSLASLTTEDDTVQSLFAHFTQKHHKQYHTAEERALRYSNFKDNYDFIQRHNANPQRTYDVGVTVFADWSREEYKAFVATGRTSRQAASTKNLWNGSHLSVTDVPTNFDWRDKGAVTNITTAGQCGSSPYFSAVTAVEGCYKMVSGNLVTLSTQQIIDCTGNEGNEGCNGGLMTSTFQGIMDSHGIDSEACYPYLGEDQNNCSFVPSPPCCVATITNYTNVQSGNESALLLALLQNVVASAMDAADGGFQLYTGGVYTTTECSTSQIDHGIPIIGYGHDAASNLDFWTLKNSWGTDWGEEGYMRIGRNMNNMCGIASFASFPTGCGVCKG